MPLAMDDAQWPQACFWAGDQAGSSDLSLFFQVEKFFFSVARSFQLYIPLMSLIRGDKDEKPLGGTWVILGYSSRDSYYTSGPSIFIRILVMGLFLVFI